VQRLPPILPLVSSLRLQTPRTFLNQKLSRPLQACKRENKLEVLAAGVLVLPQQAPPSLALRRAMSAESPKRHAVPGQEPDIFENPLEVPCVRRTGLWAIGTSSVAFLLRFYSSRSIGRALNVMVPMGVISGTVTWISCRREWVQKHKTMRLVQEMRELEPRLMRFQYLGKGEEDVAERRALVREVATKLDQLRQVGIELDKSEALDPKTKLLFRSIEESIRREDAAARAEAAAAAAAAVATEAAAAKAGAAYNGATAPDGGIRGEV
jgi:hypothetical protein